MCNIVGATPVDDTVVIEFSDGNGVVIDSYNRTIRELRHLNERHFVTQYLVSNQYYGLREIVDKLNKLPVTTVRDASVLDNTYVLSFPHVRYVIKPCKKPGLFKRLGCMKGLLSDWDAIDEIRDVLRMCDISDFIWAKMKHGNRRAFFKLNYEQYEMIIFRK